MANEKKSDEEEESNDEEQEESMSEVEENPYVIGVAPPPDAEVQHWFLGRNVKTASSFKPVAKPEVDQKGRKIRGRGSLRFGQENVNFDKRPQSKYAKKDIYYSNSRIESHAPPKKLDRQSPKRKSPSPDSKEYSRSGRSKRPLETESPVRRRSYRDRRSMHTNRSLSPSHRTTQRSRSRSSDYYDRRYR